MNVLFTVSPKYLHAVRKEINPFSFAIQGYSSISSAHSGLYNTSISKILGFMFVGDSIGDFKPKELKEFLKFLKEILGDKEKPIVFVLKSNSGLEKLKSTGLRFASSGSFDLMTDVPIRNGIGYILKCIKSPYIFEEENTEEEEYQLKSLNFTYPFDTIYLDVTKDVFIYMNLNDTISHDIILNKIKDPSNIFYKLRESYIFAYYGVFKDINLEEYRSDMNKYLQLKVLNSYIYDCALKNRSKDGVKIEAINY